MAINNWSHNQRVNKEKERRSIRPFGISSSPFHGVLVKTRLLNVILIFGWFFLILLKISVGSWKGRMASRCSGLELGPPPMVKDEASRTKRKRESRY